MEQLEPRHLLDGGAVWMTVDKPEVPEDGAETIVVTAHRAGIGLTPLTVSVAGYTNASYATPGVDYSLSGSSFSFSGSNTTADATLTITIKEDRLEEDDEAGLINVVGYLCATGVGFTIIDNDTPNSPQPKTCNCPCSCSDASSKPSPQTGQQQSVIPTANMRNDSASVQRPVIGGTAKLSATADTADSIEVIPTFNGVTGTSVFYEPTGINVSEDYQFLVAADASGLSSGRYNYELEIVEHYTGSPSVSTFIYGDQEVVRSESPEFGNGWSVGDVDHLVFQSDDGVGVVQGSGNIIWFDEDENGDYVLSRGNPIAYTLEEVSGDYELTSPDGTVALFSSTGLLTSRTDRQGNTTTYSYTDADSDSKVDEIEEITDPWGHVRTFAYDSGVLDTVTDETGRVTTFVVSGGLLQSVTEQDPDGAGPLTSQTTKFAYDADDLLTDITDDDDETTTYVYDGNGRIKEVERPGSVTEKFTPALLYGLVDPDSGTGTSKNPASPSLADDASGNYTDALGNETTYKVDRYGYPIEITDDDGNVTLIERDAHGRITKQTDPDPDAGGSLPAPITEYAFTDDGYIAQITHPDSTTEKWEYDDVFADVPDKYTNRRGKITFYEVNATTGLVDSERRVVGDDDEASSETDDIITQFTYTPAPSISGDPPQGLLASVEDALGRLTEYEYDEFGNLTLIRYAAGTADEAEEQFEYTNNRLTKYTDGLGRETEYGLDAYGRVVQITYPDPDDAGPLTSPVEESVYNSLNQLIKSIDPLGRETLYSYDARGNQTKIERPDHDGDTELTTTEMTYNAMNLLVSVKDPLDRVTTFGYDNLLRQESVKAPEVADPSTAVNEIQIVDFDGGTAGTFKLNGNSKSAVVDLTKLSGLQTALDSLWGPGNTSVTYTSSEATVKFKGDWSGTNVAQMTVSDVSGTGGADPFVTTDKGGVAADLVNPTVYTEYDHLGRVSKTTDALGNETTYVYANFGREVTITLPDPDGAGALSAPQIYREYDANGNLVEEKDANGGVTLYEYDDLDRLIQVTAADPDGGGSLTSPIILYSYDDVGNLISTMDPLGNVTEFEYDNRDRQVKVTTADPDGSGPHSALVTEYAYDDVSQMLSTTAPGGRTTAYEYDGLGRTISITAPDPDGVGGVDAPVTKYAHDAAGQMISSTDELNNTTTYAYDELGNQVLVLQADPDGDGVADIPAIFRTFDAAGQLTSEARGVANKEIQRLTFTAPTSTVTGTFSLTFDGQTTGTLDAGDSAGTVQSELESLSNIGAGNILVSTTVDGYIFIFRGTFENEAVPDITIDDSSLITTQGASASTGWSQSAVSDTNEVQVVSFGGATTGNFDLYGNSTSSMVTSLDAYGLQSALDTMWGSGNTSVYFTGSVYEVTFQGSFAGQNIAEMYVGYNGTDGYPSVSTSTAGAVGQPEIVSVSTSGPAIGGNWQLLLNSSVVGTFAWDVSYGEIQSALSGIATVTGSYPEWTITTTTNASAGTWSAQNYNLIMAADVSVTEVQSGEWVTGTMTEYTYDNLGQVATETMHGGMSRFEYDLNGNLTKVVDRLKLETAYEYDFLNRRTLNRDPLGGETVFEYDPVGNLLSLTDPVGNTTSWVYDALNRVTQETNELGKHRYFAYDAAGNLVWKKDRLNRETTFEYDRLNRQVAEEWWDGTLPGIAVTTSTEGGGGNDEVQVVTLSNATGGTFTLGFGGAWTESIDWDATTGDVDSALETLSGAGTISVSGSTGGPFTITFGGAYANQDIAPLFFQAQNLTNADQIRTIAYSFNDDADLEEVSDLDATYEYVYDGMGRVTNLVQNITGLDPEIEFESVYNAASRRTELQAWFDSTKDFTNTYNYDNLLRLTTLVQQTASGGNTIAPKRIELAYNDYGQFDRIDRYAATTSTEFVAYTQYTYFSYQRLTGLLHVTSGDFSSARSYNYDVGDRITAQSSSALGFTSNSTTYSYDDTDQLTGANHSNLTDETYEYDANGNRTMSGYVVDDNNQMTSDGVYNYTYDDEGNRLTRTKISDGYVTRYEWDHRNRLTKVTEEDNASTVLQVTTNSYDAFSQWIRRNFDSDGPGGTAAVDTFFIHESGQTVLEFDGSDDSDLTHRYLWGEMVDQFFADEKVSSLGSAGSVLWGLGDHLGTIRDLVSYNSSTDVSTIANHREFDSYGNLTAQSSVIHVSTIGFTGKMWDITTGLQNNVNRWYDPAVGRWVSNDPIGFDAGDTNLDGYVDNGPVDSTDPDGLRRRFRPCPIPPRVTPPVRPVLPPAAAPAPPKEQYFRLEDVDTYIKTFTELFNVDLSKLTPEMRARFLRTAQRGCVGLVMLRLGYLMPMIKAETAADKPENYRIDDNSQVPLYPYEIEGARFFQTYAAAAAQKQGVEASTGVKHAIVAFQHPDLIVPVLNLDPNRDRAPGEVFRDEIKMGFQGRIVPAFDVRGRAPFETGGRFNVAILVDRLNLWEHMSVGCPLELADPANAGRAIPENEVTKAIPKIKRTGIAGLTEDPTIFALVPIARRPF